MLEKMWYLPATGAFSLPELVAVSCRLAVSHRSELKVSDVHSPGFMSGTVTSAELKTRALTSLPGGCAAWTAATEIQDKTSRTLICVFICFSLPESEAFNPNRGKGRGSGVEGRRNSSCHSTLITRHSLAPATRNLKSAPPFGSLRFSTILRASAEHFEFKSHYLTPNQ